MPVCPASPIRIDAKLVLRLLACYQYYYTRLGAENAAIVSSEYVWVAYTAHAHE